VKRFLALSLIVSAISLGLVLNGSPVMAAPKDDHPTVGAQPTPDHVLGVPLDWLQGAGCLSDEIDSGGWYQRGFKSVQRAASSDALNNRKHAPILFRFTEPCYDTVNGTAGSTTKLDLGYQSYAPKYNATAAADLASVAINGTVVGTAYCQTTQWGLLTSQLARNSGSTWSFNAPGATGYEVGLVNSQPFVTGTCPYLQRIQLTVCVYAPDQVVSASVVQTCTLTTWRASDWYNDRLYTYNLDKTGDELGIVCDDGAGGVLDNPDCVPVGADPTDPDVACAGAPSAAWLDFNWIPAVVGHYAQCLTVPISGWDADGEITAAFNETALADISSEVTVAVDAFAWSESCGQLIAGTVPELGAVSITTCDWADIGAVVKPLLGVAMVVFFAWWGIGFVFSMSMSLIGQRELPEKLFGDKE